MRNKSHPFLKKAFAAYAAKWTVLVLLTAISTGSVVALFLWLLEKVTLLRWQHSWFLYLLPVAGVLIYFLYKLAGRNAEAGNNLIIEEIHKPGAGVPARMAPLVLFTTLITHLFGGSAGREGTAVQISGSFGALLARKLHLTAAETRILLLTGIAAGFGSVFGTPVTGAVFALEVLAIGTIRYDAVLPCLAASLLADITCTAWGIHHTQYHINMAAELSRLVPFVQVDILLLAKALCAGVAFGLASYLFIRLQHTIKHYSNQYITYKWLIPAIGGALIILLCFITGTRDYLGLGVVSNQPNGISIVAAFHAGGVTNWSWLWKIIFTAITLGMGFKGGEVTPLFFIGAALGNTIAMLSGAPVDLFAALGFIAVFAGATNTPLACTLMGVELFGGEYLLYYAIACFAAYYCSGQSGIYTGQRTAVSKINNPDY
ncbi:MAG: voltage-gated chloride channel family protein [Chitinophagaceae bacterium]